MLSSLKQWKMLMALNVVFLTLWTGPRVASASEIQPLEDITNTARAYVYAQLNQEGNNIEVSVSQIDRRLKLQRCSQTLEAFSPGYGSGTRMSTVGVRCNGEKPWSLYVPVTVKVFKQVVVLKRPVARNAPLGAADIAYEKTNVNRLTGGYFTQLSEIEGKILTQNLAPGAILTPYLLKSPMAIRQGQMVTLIARNSAIEVRAEGKALSRGAVGDRIKVKNLKTKRVIEGVILDNQIVSVNL